MLTSEYILGCFLICLQSHGLMFLVHVACQMMGVLLCVPDVPVIRQ